MKNISMKYSGVGSCFEALIETNTTRSSDFDLDTDIKTTLFFYLNSCILTMTRKLSGVEKLPK
jgi:hypothetical protein